MKLAIRAEIFIVVDTSPDEASNAHETYWNANYVDHPISHTQNKTRKCQGHWYGHAI